MHNFTETPGSTRGALECGGKRKRHTAFGEDGVRAMWDRLPAGQRARMDRLEACPTLPPKAVSALVPRFATALQGSARGVAASFRLSPQFFGSSRFFVFSSSRVLCVIQRVAASLSCCSQVEATFWI